MPNFSSVTLVGHLGRDPETKQLSSGDSLTSFTLATNKKRKDEDVTTWWNCTAWGKRGETIAKFLKKGDPILVVGEPCLRQYTTDNGVKGSSLEVDVRDWSFVGAKDSSSERPARSDGGYSRDQARNAASSDFQKPRFRDDDVPF